MNSFDVDAWFRRAVAKLRCFLCGHPCDPTGRHGIVLIEWKCRRCGGLYVSHVEHGNALVRADADSDQIFRDVRHLETFPALSGDGASPKKNCPVATKPPGKHLNEYNEDTN